ncbi:MAG: hypothetical protein HY902_11340 [Deltaproteobacteria bacterium]|nr:hypothetical protein [Deltaproteobacteria bacterium]
MAQQPHDEATRLHPGSGYPGQGHDASGMASDELPPELEAPPFQAQRPSTNTQFSVASMDDAPPLPPGPRRTLMPAPERQRPSLLPQGYEQPPKLPGASRQADPGLVRPVRPNSSGVEPKREGSDVIQVYDTGQSGEPKRATIHNMAPPRTSAPAAVPSPPPAQRAPIRKVATVPPVAPQRPSTVLPPPSPLPLDAGAMVGLMAAHRAQMGSLDTYARYLEVGASIVGTAAAGFMIASLVALLVTSGNTLLGAAAALVTELVGLAVALMMVALATALRHVASMASQLAALLEALSQTRR